MSLRFSLLAPGLHIPRQPLASDHRFGLRHTHPDKISVYLVSGQDTGEIMIRIVETFQGSVIYLTVLGEIVAYKCFKYVVDGRLIW